MALARDRFAFADDGLIYLDGNSLGRLPLAARDAVRDATEREWGERLIRAWNERWLDLPLRLGAKIARLLGVGEDEVAVADSTSVNLYKLAFAALAATDRRRVVTDEAQFPSDLYVLDGLRRTWPDLVVDVVAGDPADALGDDVALLCLSHAAYRTGRLHPMRELTDAAHRVGARVLWDLSHSVGAVPTPLAGADLAVGCGYKHLHGGPGAPAFLYVRRDLQDALASPIQGWFGARDAFDFGLDYAPAPGIARFLAGSPPVLSMTALEAGVDLALEFGIEAIRARSLAQTDLLIRGFDADLADLGFRLETPRDPAERGAHVLLAHPEAWRINRWLVEEEGVIGDFRAPDGLRLGPAPLTTTDDEIARALAAIRRTAATRAYEALPSVRFRVT